MLNCADKIIVYKCGNKRLKDDSLAVRAEREELVEGRIVLRHVQRRQINFALNLRSFTPSQKAGRRENQSS